MDTVAKVTPDGQLVVPKAVLCALGVTEGDRVSFEVEQQHVVMTRILTPLDLMGAVEVPPDKRGVPWEEIISTAHRVHAETLMTALEKPEDEKRTTRKETARTALRSRAEALR